MKNVMIIFSEGTVISIYFHLKLEIQDVLWKLIILNKFSNFFLAEDMVGYIAGAGAG